MQSRRCSYESGLVDESPDRRSGQPSGNATGAFRHASSIGEAASPGLAIAESDLALIAPALDIELERRLGERKERRPESHVDAIDLEECPAEFMQDPFQMAEMRALVDDEALDLVKLRRVGGIGID